jgi:deoxyribose-phosphate aldolase
MAMDEPILTRVEASLLDCALSLSDARRRLEAWHELGVQRVVAYPGLLEALGTAAFGGFDVAGAVSFPNGGDTLANKRMGLLECVRLGAKAASVVLSPHLILQGEAALLEREMRALVETAPEIEIRFVAEFGRLSGEAALVLIRVLRDCRPAFLVPSSGSFPPALGPAGVDSVRRGLSRKIGLLVGEDVRDPALAQRYFASGADRITSSAPEELREEAP